MKTSAPTGEPAAKAAGLSAPCWFLSHGAPTIALADDPTTRFWRSLSGALDDCRAILVVSAHWETMHPAFSAAGNPGTIHDFFGFPEPLYQLGYPVAGAPDIASRAAALLNSAGIPADLDPDRGLDHGAWTPLLHIRPAADIPVLQLSIQPHRGVSWHLALGKALAPLRQEKVAIVASGGAVHNVRDAMTRMHRGDRSTPEWASSFDRNLSQLVANGDAAGIADLLHTPAGRMAHPRDEHLLPLLVAIGAGGGAGDVLHSRFDCGSLSMTAYGFSGT